MALSRFFPAIMPIVFTMRLTLLSVFPLKSCARQLSTILLVNLIKLFTMLTFVSMVTLTVLSVSRGNAVKRLFLIFKINLILEKMSKIVVRRFLDDFHLSTFPPPIETASLTVPDMHVDIATMISRYRKGLAVPRVPMQNVDFDASAFDSMNRFERIDASKALKARVETLNQELLSQKASAAAKRKERNDAVALDKAVQAKLDEITRKSDG